MSRRIYVASSWRNDHQPEVVSMLRAYDLQVYDFRDPLRLALCELNRSGPWRSQASRPGAALPRGFRWSEIDENWKSWTADEYRHHLTDPDGIARIGYLQDHEALEWCNVCMLVQPCGRSSHLELGFAIGSEKTGYMYFPDGVTVEPELMAALCYTSGGGILVGQDELSAWAADAARTNLTNPP